MGDAERLSFADGEFDAVISTFGVMFASRPEAAAAELARICRPGGRLALTTWRPDSTPARMFAVMRRYLPPPASAVPSPFEWGRPERIGKLLGKDFELGFETGTSFYREPSGEAAWETFLAGFGPVKALAASLDEQQQAEFRRDFIALHESFRTELGITFPRDYLVAVGIRR